MWGDLGSKGRLCEAARITDSKMNGEREKAEGRILPSACQPASPASSSVGLNPYRASPGSLTLSLLGGIDQREVCE